MVTINKSAPCPLCGADDFKVKYPSTWCRFAEPGPEGKPEPKSGAAERDTSFFRCTSSTFSNHGDIVCCRRCGMLYNNPRPDALELEQAYRLVEDPAYLEEMAAREATFTLSLHQMHRFIQPPGELMDIGCYTGIFMKIAQEAGWRTSGLELSQWAAEKARALKAGAVFSEPPERLDLPQSSFDVVSMWDVIEHLPQPAETLATAFRLLKPGGVLAFSTHRADSLAARCLGTKYPFFMDMHVVHFTRRTIEKILEQQGFRLLAILPHRRILRASYFLDKLSRRSPMAKKFLLRLSAHPFIARRMLRINFLGLINIFARKPK